MAMPSAWTMRSSRSRSATPRISYSRKTRGFTPRVVARRLGPVRGDSPLPINAVRVVEVAQIGPVILVESRHLLEVIFRDVDEEPLARLVDGDRGPWHREQLPAKPENPAERQHGVGDAARDHVDHQLLDAADIVTVEIDH